MGHLLMENRSGLVVNTRLTQATGTAEREAAADMLGALPAGGRVIVGADKLFDTQGFVAEMRRLGVTPHVAQHTDGRRSAIDGRTTRHAGSPSACASASALRKGLAGSRLWAGLARRATARVGWQFTLTAAAYNLVRIPKLLAA